MKSTSHFNKCLIYQNQVQKPTLACVQIRSPRSQLEYSTIISTDNIIRKIINVYTVARKAESCTICRFFRSIWYLLKLLLIPGWLETNKQAKETGKQKIASDNSVILTLRISLWCNSEKIPHRLNNSVFSGEKSFYHSEAVVQRCSVKKVF